MGDRLLLAFGGIDGVLFALQVVLLVTAPLYPLLAVAYSIWGEEETTWVYQYDDGRTVTAENSTPEEARVLVVFSWVLTVVAGLAQVSLAMCLYCLRRIGAYLREMNGRVADVS